MRILRILAVDVSALFSLYWHAAQGTQQEFSEPYLRTIQAVRKHREGFDRVAICCDNGRSFRAAIWPSYKANRPDRGEPYREQLRRTIEALGQDGCSVFRAPLHPGYSDDEGAALNLEADDVIGTLCAWASEDQHEVVILSSDKDLCQLVGEGVWVRNLTKPDQPDMDASAVEAKFQLKPERIPDLLALAGDKSDNYKPIEGVGDVRAMQLIKAYGSALDIFRAENLSGIHQVVGDAPAKKIREAGAEPVRRCLEVATIVRNGEVDFGPLLEEPTYGEVEVPPLAEPAAPPIEQRPMAALAQRSSSAPALAVVGGGAAVAARHEMPYWAQEGYLARLHEIGRCFVAARCFPNVATPEQAMVVGMFAHECGVGIATAMQHAYFVHGRLGWSATWFLMRIEASGTKEKFEIQICDDAKCSILVKRKGSPQRVVTWEWKEAEKAGLTKPTRNGEPSNHVKFPKEMNLARCIARAARQEWRAECGGMYLVDERSDEVPEEAIARQVADSRQIIANQRAA